MSMQLTNHCLLNAKLVLIHRIVSTFSTNFATATNWFVH